MKKVVLLLIGTLLCFGVALILTDGGSKTGKQVWKETFNNTDTVVVIIK